MSLPFGQCQFPINKDDFVPLKKIAVYLKHMWNKDKGLNRT